jgi:hypothetical protein
LNTNTQYYKGVPLRLIIRKDYHVLKARRYLLNETNQNVWVPCQYLEEDGTIKARADFVFIKSKRKFELAGISEAYKQFKRPNY